MERIYIVGASGSGKSTLAQNMSDKLSIPKQDLDDLFWVRGENWQPVPREEFQENVRSITSGDKWIIEGAQEAARDIVLAKADTLIWVDPGLPRLLSQLVGRTYNRITRKPEFCNGKHESIRNTFSSNSIFYWATKTYFQIRADLSPIFNNTSGVNEHKHLQLVHLTGRRAANTFIQTLTPNK